MQVTTRRILILSAILLAAAACSDPVSIASRPEPGSGVDSSAATTVAFH